MGESQSQTATSLLIIVVANSYDQAAGSEIEAADTVRKWHLTLSRVIPLLRRWN